ncbi:MAG: LamG-like jellyroll fold domain-containing protein [Mariprofundaceae bacterium]|nr:LamG-like jellyroll fold domain-containing protein [Mariprofundaceae bacterium]
MARVKIKVSGAPDVILDQTIGTVGSVANAQGPLVDSDFVDIANSAYYSLSGNANKTGGTSGPALLVKLGVNDPNFDAKGFFGRENVVRFNNNNDDTLFTANSFFNPGNTTDWSLSFWQKWNRFPPPASNDYIVSMGAEPGLFGYLIGIIGSTQQLNVRVGDGGPLVTVFDAPIPLGEWSHCSLTYDSASNIARFYLDGVKVGESAVTAVAATLGVFTLGSLSHASDIYETDTEMQDFSFEHRLLSDSEVNARYSKRFTNNKQISAGHVLTNDSFPFNDLSGRVSYWNLDTLNDGSGNTPPLTNNGGILFTGSDIYGESRVATFDGANQTITSTNAFFEFDGSARPFSIGGWFNPIVWGGGVDQDLVNIHTGSPVRGPRIDIASDGSLFLAASENGTVNTTVSIPASNLIGWHHVAMTYDGVTLRSYLDGNSISSAPFAGQATFSGTQLFQIGGINNPPANKLKGSAADIFFGHSYLSNEDIRKLYSARVDLPNSNTPAADQDYSASHWIREDDKIHNHTGTDMIVDISDNAVYLDTGLPSGSTIILKQSKGK